MLGVNDLLQCADHWGMCCWAVGRFLSGPLSCPIMSHCWFWNRPVVWGLSPATPPPKKNWQHSVLVWFVAQEQQGKTIDEQRTGGLNGTEAV